MYKFDMAEKIIQVKDSIPWVRCASSNVSIFIIFHRLSLEHPLDPSQMGRVFPVLGFLGCTSFGISNYHQLIFQIWSGRLSSYIPVRFPWAKTTSWQLWPSCQGSGGWISCSSQPHTLVLITTASSTWQTRAIETHTNMEGGFQPCGVIRENFI